MKKIIKQLNNKKLLSILIIVVFVVTSFIIAKPAQASLDWVIGLFGGLMAAIVFMLGKLLVMLMGVLVYIAQYSKFIHSPVISKGWAMVRDLCNMFFVVILLVISFATILRIEKYNYKKWLPKLILMAVLINFSKTICGVMIDVAQVIMLSFVNAFKTIGGTNLSTMLGIQNWQKMRATGEIGSNWDLIASYFLAVIYVVVSIVVIAAMIGVLVMRIIMIWVYVVLSPLAYLLSSFPDGQTYASKWWTQFTQNLIVGPVLAFFIWLSFAAITPQTEMHNALGMDKLDLDQESTIQDTTGSIGTSDLMIQFIISIGLLIGGLKISQEIGGAAGSMAGKISSKGFRMAKVGAAGVGAAALWAAKKPVRMGVDKLHEKTGVDLDVKRVYSGIQERRKERAAERYSRGQTEAGRKMQDGSVFGKLTAMTGNPADAWDQIMSKHDRKKLFKSGKSMKAGQTAAAAEVYKTDQQLDVAKFKSEYYDNENNPQKLQEMSVKVAKDLEVKVKEIDIERLRVVDADDKEGQKNKEETLKKLEVERQTLEDKQTFINQKSPEIIDPANREIAQFKLDYANNDKGDRPGMAKKIDLEVNGLATELSRLQKLPQAMKDPSKEKETQAKLDVARSKQKFAQDNKNNVFSSVEKDKFRNEINNVYTKQPIQTSSEEKAAVQQEIAKYTKAKEKQEEIVTKNTPGSILRARQAEQKAVKQEMSKIDSISDPTELLRILREGIRDGNKDLVKAVTLKMTKDYNDNEFLTPLAGDSGYKGLQKLMREFANKNSKNYAGFNQQEAMALGSQIAEINKTTNHWGATSAYAMENGRWRETTTKEHNTIRGAETGKLQVQALLRNSNRLAYGYHDASGKFHIDIGGVMLLERINNKDNLKNMETMNESAAKHIYEAIMSSPQLKAKYEIAPAGVDTSLIERLEQRLGEISKMSGGDQFEQALDLGYQQ